MGSCAAPSAKGDDKFITTDYLQQCRIEKGEREATLKIARTMLQNGIDRNTVMKMTGLTEDDLAQIRH